MQFPIQLQRLTHQPTEIAYCVQSTRFGLLVSEWITLDKQAFLCGQQFCQHEAEVLAILHEYWPKASCTAQLCPEPRWLAALEDNQSTSFNALNLVVVATDFQWQIWQALLLIPYATTCSYLAIAQQLNKPHASRAVGTAIGQNPIAYLIPCHRVLRSNGQLGGYRWGLVLKERLLAWEQEKL